MIHSDGLRTVVPVHSGEIIGRGLLAQILRDCQITREEFRTLLYSARFGALLLKSRLRLQAKFFCPGKSPEISRF